jgi:hypothetical protein
MLTVHYTSSISVLWNVLLTVHHSISQSSHKTTIISQNHKYPTKPHLSRKPQLSHKISHYCISISTDTMHCLLSVIFRQITSTCSKQAYCSSSGGTIYTAIGIFCVCYVGWLLVGSDILRSTVHITLSSHYYMFRHYLVIFREYVMNV